MAAPWVYGDTIAASNPELTRWVDPSWEGGVLAMRLDIGPPLDIFEVRQALALAIDNQAIIDDLYGGSGVMLNFPTSADIPESIYTPLEKQPPEVRELFEYHPDKAKTLMATAGYDDGFKTEVMFKGEPMMSDIMSMIKGYWLENLNVELELKPVDPAAFWGVALAMEHKEMACFFDDAPTPISNFYSTWAEDALCNLSRWVDPIFTDMLAAQRAALTVDEQNALLKDVNNYVISHIPAILLPGSNSLRYAWPWVKNYYGESMSEYRGSIGLFSILWIDQAMKADMGY